MNRRPLPAGTVTFLFTDIEGSTRLLQETGAAYVALLEDHRRLLRAAFAAHGGREVNTEGDSFFVAFQNPREAVTAAAEGQRVMGTHDWPEGRRVRVRMGLHTGEATDAGGDYVSLAVHEAARIAAASHGGQVVVSETTAALVRDRLADGLSLRDLGEHRLKDFPRPAHLYQLEGAGLENEFPPLRTLGRSDALPAPLASFVGRQDDVAAVAALLRDNGVRLVTLAGPGGIGKTRLALEAARAVADAFPGGTVFVPLAAVVDTTRVLDAIADAVGAQRDTGAPLLDAVAAALGEHRTLVVIDNFEQVAGAAPTVAAILEHAAGAVALVTSRQVLRLGFERPYHLGPLPEAVAVRLFAERARAARPGFSLTDTNRAAVAEICRRLDGLPLAIELAAARVRLLPPQALLARMNERLDVLGRGPVDLPERQRTLRATMEWSYGLLGSAEQTLFARLAVFTGGWTLEAAEVVCGRAGEPAVLDTVSELLANSLLVASEDTGIAPRFDMLQTVHAYARDKLASLPDRPETEQRHTEWILTVLRGRLRAHGRAHRVWFEHFDRERANLRAAVQRGLEAGDVATVAQLVRDAFVALAHRDDEAEVVEWLERALSRGADAPPAVRGRLLVVRALAATIFGEFARARSLLAEGRRLLPYDAEYAYDHALAAATDAYGAMADDPVAAVRLIDEAATRLAAVGEQLGQAYMEATAGNRALSLDDLDAAEGHYANAVRLAEDLGDDAMRGRALSLFGLTVLARGDLERARRAVIDGARVNRTGGQPTSMAYSLDGLAALALADGRAVVAARARGSAAAVRRRVGHPASPAFVPLLDDLVSRSRSQLGDDAYAAACAEAEQWDVIEALDQTLEELEAPLAPEHA